MRMARNLSRGVEISASGRYFIELHVNLNSGFPRPEKKRPRKTKFRFPDQEKRGASKSPDLSVLPARCGRGRAAPRPRWCMP